MFKNPVSLMFNHTPESFHHTLQKQYTMQWQCMAENLFSFITPLLGNISKIKAAGTGMQTSTYFCHHTKSTKFNENKCKSGIISL